jgi:hypothetical protein
VRQKGCGNDGLWTVRKTKSRFSLTAHEPLEIANHAISTFPQPRLANAMEKWKSKSRIPTFPRRFPLSQKPKTKGDQSRPVTLVFRLISGLENAIAATISVSDPYAELVVSSANHSSADTLRSLVYEFPD